MVEMMKVHREQFGWFKENINLRIIKCHLGNYIQEIEIIVWELWDVVFVVF